MFFSSSSSGSIVFFHLKYLRRPLWAILITTPPVVVLSLVLPVGSSLGQDYAITSRSIPISVIIILSAIVDRQLSPIILVIAVLWYGQEERAMEMGIPASLSFIPFL